MTKEKQTKSPNSQELNRLLRLEIETAEKTIKLYRKRINDLKHILKTGTVRVGKANKQQLIRSGK